MRFLPAGSLIWLCDHSFQRLVREIAQDFKTDLRFQCTFTLIAYTKFKLIVVGVQLLLLALVCLVWHMSDHKLIVSV